MQRRDTNAKRSTNQGDFQAIFVRRVHQLIEMAYQRMQPVNRFELKKEEDISGELARHVDDLLDDLNFPWMRFFSLAPERHVDEPHKPEAQRRYGKHRKRLDFRFTCRQRKPVQRFIFEAKSLRQSGAGQLLDEDGLGRILCGHYAREDSVAGLLGYVQIATVAEHSTALSEELRQKTDQYGITEEGHWTVVRFRNGPANTFRTTHRRPKLEPVKVFTTLLLFR